MLSKITHPSMLLGLFLALALAACQSAPGPSIGGVPSDSAPTGPAASSGESSEAQPALSSATITLGDIDPEDPIKKIERFQPLADYLAANLSEYGIERGRVVIAHDIREMAELLADGKVDVYMDSAFPSLQVQEMAGTRVVARRWKDSAPEYWSVYVARQDSGIDSVDDFVGKVLAFEEPHSTSGFILPAGTLVDRGFPISEVERPQDPVSVGEIGYFFTQDEENTFEMIFRSMVAGGAVSNQDFDSLDEEIKAELVSFDRTVSVPRQFVSVRSELDPAMVDRMVELLAGLEHFEEGQQILQTLKSTTRFDALPSESAESIQELERLIELVID